MKTLFRTGSMFTLAGLLATGLMLLGLLQPASFPEKPLQAERAYSSGGEEEQEEEGIPGNPAWFHQLYEMKKHPGYPIPRRFGVSLAEKEALRKTGSSFLSNVQEVGPSNVGGRTRALIIDSQDPDHYIAGGVSGGIWHSFNAGGTWTPINDQAPTLSVTDLVQSPFNPSVMYYCTGEPTGNSADIPGDGVFKSTDGGFTWSQLSATNVEDFDACWAIRHSLVDSNTIYVATAGFGLQRSTDGGQTFEEVLRPVGSSHVTDVEVFPDGSVIAGIRDVGLYRSADGSPNSFTELTSGLPATNTFRAIRIAYPTDNPDIVYAAYEDRLQSTYDSEILGIWRSNDGGQNWSQTGGRPEDDGHFMRFPWYAFAFEVKPDDPNVLVLGSVDLTYSLDGGDNWLEATYGHADQHIVRFLPNNNNQFLIGNDGGVYRYSVLTASFTREDLNTNYNVTQYYAGAFFPGSTVDAYGGTQDNGTNAVQNGFAEFNDIFGGDGSYTQVNQQQPDTAFVSFQNGRIFRTYNATSISPSFESVANQLDSDDDFEIDDQVWFINPYEMNPLDGDQLFFVTRERIWRSNDGANNWTPLTNSLPSDPWCVGISNDLNPDIYVGGQGSMLFRIPDARNAQPGDEINLSASAPPEVAGSFLSSINVHPDDPSTVFVTFSDFFPGPRIYRVIFANTANPVWIPISGDLPESLPVNWMAVDPQNPNSVYVAGTDYGVYTTTNGGENWHKEIGIPNVAVFQVKLRPADRKLFFFTHGRGLWTADLSTLVSREELLATQTQQWKVGPNPVQNATVGIYWEQNNLRPQHLRLRAVTGQVSRHYPVTRQAQQKLSTTGLAPGLYFLEAEFADGALWRKRLVIR